MFNLKKNVQRAMKRKTDDKAYVDPEVRVSRAVFRKRDQDYSVKSDMNLSDLVGQETNIGDVESTAVDRIAWANRKGAYALWVAISRFLSRYALDPEFRQEFQENPEKYEITLISLKVDPSKLFVFDELGDRKVHPYPYKKGDDTIHYLVQEGSVDEASALNPESVKAHLDFFNETDIDTVLRVIEILFIGDKELYNKIEAKILKADREGNPLSLLEATHLSERFSTVESQYREDILARRLAIHLMSQSDYSKLRFFYDDLSETTYEGEMANQFVEKDDFPTIRDEYIRDIEGQIKAKIDMEASAELRRSIE